ncbi:enoyl-CoA hydratase/isomerase family protein [Mycobacterium sp. NAZ190054]|uniref:enoyl-CoA hydratase/isomerase family protein n=1 Tax=Mycobacterium sp. NAZ190054 TaxID=1747766 RepID=UPI00079A9BEC|nr:enoyl-CoA hydratase/isomerase family protein [Mycobacterium sp. NAZ190054]KWX67092.1 hypothetical protein ASJ79_22970 [Mycobacterium sp. NAZ190054]
MSTSNNSNSAESFSYTSINVERDGAVLVLTLNRPDKLNAVNRALHHELEAALVAADSDESSNVIVLTGAGRAFCAGGDTSEQADAKEFMRTNRKIRNETQRFIETLLRVEKPIVAMVNGPAIGLGANIALLSDIIVAAEDATIADTHTKVGLVAADGGTVVWPLLIGFARAKELLLFGKPLDGKTAAELGLINHAVPADELRAFTMTIAHQLAALMPYSVRATKITMNRMLRHQVLDQMDACSAWQSIALQSDDRLEAFRAFHEKRSPNFTGS